MRIFWHAATAFILYVDTDSSKLPKAVIIVAVPLEILSHKNIRSLFLLVNFPRIIVGFGLPSDDT